jgi:hypothetical protein
MEDEDKLGCLTLPTIATEGKEVKQDSGLLERSFQTIYSSLS